jgi:taurine dioxygenase
MRNEHDLAPEVNMSEWISESSLAWRPLEPFGAELDHDLSKPLSAEQADGFVRLLWSHGLILARDQHLTMERQQALCALAGPILLRKGENGYLSNETGHDATTSALSWHSDAAYTHAPFDAIALHAVDVLDDASSTFFVNASDALDTLPAPLRRNIEGKETEMISPSYDAISLRTCDTRDPVAQKRGIRPMIYRNPHNGRNCIWVSELQTARVLDMDWEKSRDLLHSIYDHVYQPAHVFEHRWRNGDFVIWDNIALQHMRRSLKECGKRVLQRVIVGKEGVAPHIQG